MKKYFNFRDNKEQYFLFAFIVILILLSGCTTTKYVIDREIVARQNPVFDLNKDLKIHKHEIRTALQKSIPNEYKNLFL